MRAALAIIFASISMLPMANAADDNMRPGLWEIITSSDLLWLASQIPPEQMQNLRNLARQYGVDMPDIRMGEAVSRVCITQEMAERQELPIFYQSELGCSTQHASRNGNQYRVDFVCEGPDLKGKGTAEGSVTSPESFSGNTRFSGVAQGQSVDEQADIRGRWVDANCGTVKPL